MPSPRLETTYSNTISNIQVLENYRDKSLRLDATYQNFVAEVILLRLFSIIENSIKETALKLACETPYRNGVSPAVIYRCRSQIDAENQFKTYNRVRPVNIKWTKVSYVNSSVQEIIPNTEPFRIMVGNHGSYLNQIRVVRNHIAHKTSSTYQQYKMQVRQIFGANLRIQPGPLLTSTKRLQSAKLDDYLTLSKILIDDITKG